MSRGHYLSLEDARNVGQIDRFCKEHQTEGDKVRFERLLLAVAKMPPEADQTSDQDASAYCSDTRTPSRISEGASGKRERASHGSTTSTAPKSPRSR